MVQECYPSVVDTGGKFLPALLKPVSKNLPTVPGVVHVNLGKYVTGGLPPVFCVLLCFWYTSSSEFSKKFESALMELSGAPGKVIHEKT
jgi:hypothetical protein